MKNYRFHIVRSIKLKVDHSLLVLPGTELKDVKEYSPTSRQSAML